MADRISARSLTEEGLLRRVASYLERCIDHFGKRRCMGAHVVFHQTRRALRIE